MIGAGVRAIPVGHTHGQQVLAYLQGDIRNLAQELVDREVFKLYESLFAFQIGEEAAIDVRSGRAGFRGNHLQNGGAVESSPLSSRFGRREERLFP